MLFYRARFHEEGFATFPAWTQIQGFSFGAPGFGAYCFENMEGFDSWSNLPCFIW